MIRKMTWLAAGAAALALAACAKQGEKQAPPSTTAGAPPAAQAPKAEAPVPKPAPVATPVAEAGLRPEALAAMRADYPLDACPISGKALGSMGEPYEVLVEGRLVRLCCDSCVPKVLADPEAVFGRIDAAATAAMGS